MSDRKTQTLENRVLKIWNHDYLKRGSGSNFQPLFTSMLGSITRQVSNQGAALYLRERGHLMLMLSSDEGKPRRYRKHLPLTRLRSLLEKEVSESPDLCAKDFLVAPKDEQLLTFSLRLDDTPKGLLLLSHDHALRVTGWKMTKIRSTLVNLATALSMVDALKREKERSSHLRLINRLCQQIDSLVGESNLYDRIVSLIQEVFRYDHVGLYLVNRADNALILQSLAGKYKGIILPGQKIAFGEGMISWTAAHGKTLLSNDVRENPHFLNLTPELIPTESELCVPIRVDDEIIGVLNVEHSELLSFDEDDINAVEVLAGRIAVAIKKARLYDELHDSHARLQATVSSMRQGLMIVDADFHILWTNNTFEQWGYSNGKGEYCYAVFGSSAERCKSCPAQRTFSMGKGYQETMKGAGERYYSVTSAPITGVDGRVRQVLEVFDDVTEQLASQSVLEHLKHELERSQRLASIGEVTANIVHEIRNPINALSQAAELLESDLTLDEEQRQLMDVVKEEVGRLNDITTAYLSLANGKQRDFSMASLKGVMERVVTLLCADQMITRRIKITLDCPDGLPPVRCDPNAIRQVFWNLLLNSVESIDGQGSITLRAHLGPDGYTVKVADSGKGIPAANMDRIFDPFHSTKQRGTGLGLAIVKRIIEDHGWRIAVESKEGEGTVFTIIVSSQAD